MIYETFRYPPAAKPGTNWIKYNKVVTLTTGSQCERSAKAFEKLGFGMRQVHSV